MKNSNKILLMIAFFLTVAAIVKGQQKSNTDVKSMNKSVEPTHESKKMKIITIEEHFLNMEITNATRDEVEKIAPGHAGAFIADFGSRTTMKPEQLFDIGAGRIADMDANGIDMQILSYNAPATELLPEKIAHGNAEKLFKINITL